MKRSMNNGNGSDCPLQVDWQLVEVRKTQTNMWVFVEPTLP